MVPLIKSHPTKKTWVHKKTDVAAYMGNRSFSRNMNINFQDFRYDNLDDTTRDYRSRYNAGAFTLSAVGVAGLFDPVPTMEILL